MKNYLVSALVCLSAIMLLFPVVASAQGVTVFYKSGDKTVQLMPLMPSGGGATKVGKMFVPGLTPQIVRTYDGAEAPVKIFEAKPTFLLTQPAQFASLPGHTGRDVKIVRLKARKDHRELQITKGSNMFTFKAGTDENQTVPVEVTESDSGFRIVATRDLPPGEYIVVLGNSPIGYDFAVLPGTATSTEGGERHGK